MRATPSSFLAVLLGATLAVLLAAPSACLGLGEGYEGMPVAEFKIEGLSRSLSQELRGGLELARKPGFLGVFGYAVFSPDTLAEDLKRSRLFLARSGYPSATVEVEMSLDDGGERVKVVFRVEPGPPVLVSRIEVEGFPPEIPRADLRAALRLREGDRFTDIAAAGARQRLVLEMREAGYADAELSMRVEPRGSEEVALFFEATAGPRYLLGNFSISGPSPDLVPVVERIMSFPTGEPYSPQEIDNVEWRLRTLDLFRRIDMTATPAGDQVLDLDYELTESMHRRFEFGVGWFTDEKWRVSSSWEHRNLFKAGRGFRVSGVFSSLIRNLITSTWWPAVWSTPYTSILSLDLRQELEEGYELRENKVSWSFLHRPRNGSVLSLGYSVSLVDLADNTLEASADQDPEGILNRVTFNLQLDRRDDLLQPTRGRVYLLRLQATPPVPPSIGYYAKAYLGHSSVHRIRGRLFGAWRAALGVGTPYHGSEDIIISERFFSGGARSHRGYQRQRLGPKDPLGKPLGGEVLWESSGELRFPLWKSLGGALFVDVAQVWRKWDQVLSGGFEWAVGPSVAVNTPVGPIRLDYGFRVPARDDGEPNQVLHLQVGHPF